MGPEVDIIRGVKPLIQYSKNKLIVYRKGIVAIYNLHNKKMEKKVNIPLSIWQKCCCHLRFLNRIFRVEPRAIELISDSVFIIAVKGAVYRVDFSRCSIILEHRFISGMNSPLSFCKIENIQGMKDGIYYGEYTANLEKKPVSVYRRGLKEKDGWEKVYEFPERTIHHIHCIQINKENQKVYLLTGDDDAASGIWSVKDNFSEVVAILKGKQEYRTCRLFFHNNEIVYATDSPMEQNFLYRYKISEDKWMIMEKQVIPGPCIYGECNNEILLISTTVEPDSCLEGKFKLSYFLGKKRGKGIRDNYVHVIKGNFESGFEEYECIKKDRLPMGLFGFGSVQFPKYSFSKYNHINMYYTAVKKRENCWYVFKNE